MSVVLGDFKPINSWTPEANGPHWYRNGEDVPMFIIDGTTQRRYSNETTSLIRFKCFLLTIGTPLVHAIASIVNVVIKFFKLISFSHFWMHKEGETKYNVKARLADAGADLLRIVATPLAYAGLELSAIFGLFTPLDGRKLYATMERTMYGRPILAPCFQPDPTSHLFGSDINNPNGL